MKIRSLFLSAALAASGVQAAGITVSAAASLSDAFKQIVQAYGQAYPGDKVKLNTAASGVLLRQLEQGAPVDVLATADAATMDKADQKQLIDRETRKNFARNALVLAVPKNAAVSIRHSGDLNRVRRIAIGKPESVPAGAYAKAALEKQGLFDVLRPKFVYTQNVRQALDYVVRGEVDAGLVYRTDAQLKQFAVKTAYVVPTEAVLYPVAVTRSSAQPAAARRFAGFVQSPEAQRILQSYGFSRP
ncbi:molybdate ABC transporter substrate-binding protein [Neisseria leonii]|uniref:Molybdate ABC transporter substrate-binding protein n=1 Tax=Neisseria leonii TaxID=2995413 RepID=A0A9X4E1A9_9NEIS|nr:molybdate ABC transporter substrate-binding protein [Neisseria sp. 51.81]MDD9327254.1 molybdate ABC transporter substrate-binding protein [Neisseria sp. 51.81]